MKPAVIYFINFFHVIKLRERKVAKRRLTLVSLHFFPDPYSKFMTIAKCRCHLSHIGPMNFNTVRMKMSAAFRTLNFDYRVGIKARKNLMAR